MFPFQKALKDSTQPQQAPHPGKYRKKYRGKYNTGTFKLRTFKHGKKESQRKSL